MRNTGPRRRARERAGREPGPARPPRRRARRPFGATLGRWSGRESASVPSAAKSEAATVPSAAVGETTAGVAVEAAVAAILARSMGPGRSRSGAKKIIQARRRGRSGRGGHGRGWSVQADHGGGRVGPGRSRPGESVRAEHGGGRGARAGPGRGDEVRRVPASRPKNPCSKGREREEDSTRAARGGGRTRVGQGWNARRHGRADKFWVRGDSNEQTCHLHFGRIVTGGVHSRLAAAGRVQGVGGSVTFTPHPPPAENGRSSR